MSTERGLVRVTKGWGAITFKGYAVYADESNSSETSLTMLDTANSESDALGVVVIGTVKMPLP